MASEELIQIVEPEMASNAVIYDAKSKFNQLLIVEMNKKKDNSIIKTKAEYMALIETIKGSKLKPQSKQSHQEAYLNRTYAVFEVATEERVIKKRSFS